MANPLETLLPNSNSTHSRALRQRTALAHRKRVIAEGGLYLTMLLRKPAADALRTLTDSGATKTEAVEAALIDAARSKT